MTPGLGRTQSRQVYTPMQPVRITSGGGMSAARVSVGSLMAESPEAPAAEESADALTGAASTQQAPVAAEPVRPANLPSGRITSLVPKVSWEYKDPMLAGEKAFREGNYPEALAQFEKARQISHNCPESLLALTHASLAMAKDSYEDPARYLAATIIKFPYLPVVDVNLRDFLAKPAEYERIVTGLENAVKADPKNASALLVLGYLKMRDNLFPVSARLLKDAAKSTTSREQAYAIDVLLKAMDEVREDAREDAPKLAPPVTLDSAGLQLALPEGFVFQPLSDPNQFMAATRGAQASDKPQMISGFAYAVDKDVTPRMTLDQMAAAASSNLAVAKLTQVEEMEVPYLGTTAVARLYECEFMGSPVLLVRLCFARDIAGADKKDAKLMYVLGMGLLASDAESLLPTLSSVARSVSFVDPKRPAELTPSATLNEIKLPEFGLAIGQPQGWAGQSTARGYRMAATDFLSGGSAGAQAEAITVAVPATSDSKTFGEKVIQDRVKEGQRITVLSQGAARLAGLEGHEFLLRRGVSTAAAGQAASASSAPAEPAEVLEMARLVCVPAAEGKKTVVALVVRRQDMDEQALRQSMDVLAGGLRLLKP